MSATLPGTPTNGTSSRGSAQDLIAETRCYHNREHLTETGGSDVIIDFHSHFVPEAIVRRNLPTGEARAITYVGGVPAQTMHAQLGDMAARLAAMDEAGIDAAVLSAPLPHATLADCQEINDDLHRQAQAHSG